VDAPGPSLRKAGHLQVDFIAHMRPSARTLSITPVRREPGLLPQSQSELTIVEDGVADSGPADTVEFVTNSVAVDSGCPAPYTFQSYCGNVTLRHFFAGQGFNNVYVHALGVTDAMSQPLSGHDALNSDPTALGLDATHGLWRYTTAGYSAASGILTRYM